MDSAVDNNIVSTALFFNTWAAELDPPTARGGFSIFHEGLSAEDQNKFPVATYGLAKQSNTARYAAICAAYASQGARMDHLAAAALGQVAQRKEQVFVFFVFLHISSLSRIILLEYYFCFCGDFFYRPVSTMRAGKFGPGTTNAF